MTRPIDEQLYEATRAGRIDWNFVPRDMLARTSLSEEHVVGQPLRAKVGARWFRLYEYRYKAWLDEDRYEWARDVCLEVADEATVPMSAPVPVDSHRWELLAEARKHAARLDALAQELEVTLATKKAV